MIEKVEDISEILHLAKEFTAKLVDVSVSDHWLKLWAKLISGGIGHVFSDQERTGAIGMIIAPDVHSGVLQATEGFWYVSEKARGTNLGARLFLIFEKYAQKKGCKRLKMAHMVDSMPDELQDFYIKMGYKKSEVHYLKEVRNG